MPLKDELKAFLDDLKLKYNPSSGFHRRVKSHLEQLCEDVTPEEKENAFNEIEECYIVYSMMEQSMHRMAELKTKLQRTRDPDRLEEYMEEYKQEKLNFLEYQVYAGRKVQQHQKKTDDLN